MINGPYHIGIIPDGNRRWAKKNSKDLLEAYRRGAEKVKEIVEYLMGKNVPYITVYVFSLKNFERTDLENERVFEIMKSYFCDDRNYERIMERSYSVVFAGKKEIFPKDLQKCMENRIVSVDRAIVLLVGYDADEDLKQAFEKCCRSGAANWRENLWVPSWIPPVDLLVRTAEKRLSGFPLYLISYAELYFIDKYWPDVTVDDFQRALEDYSKRERRFGK